MDPEYVATVVWCTARSFEDYTKQHNLETAIEPDGQLSWTPVTSPPKSCHDDKKVNVALDLLMRVSESDKHVYRRPTGATLRFMFTAAWRI